MYPDLRVGPTHRVPHLCHRPDAIWRRVINTGPVDSDCSCRGIVLGFITYRAQMRWYGDDRESALIKGVIIGLLTAIPTPLPAILYLPSGLIGLIHMARRGWGRLTFRGQNFKQ